MGWLLGTLLGMRHALVVSGEDGLDDITVTGPTAVFEVRGDVVSQRTVTPFDLGLSVHPAAEIEGGTPEQNAQIFRDVLAGEGRGADPAAEVRKKEGLPPAPPPQRDARRMRDGGREGGEGEERGAGEKYCRQRGVCARETEKEREKH